MPESLQVVVKVPRGQMWDGQRTEPEECSVPGGGARETYLKSHH